MTADHPSIETVADYRAGLLPEHEQAAVSAHVVSCVDCTAASEAVDEVVSLLTATSSAPLPMPPDVAARLDGALRDAGHEQSGTVVPMGRSSAPSAQRRPRWALPLVAAAAAVVAVTAISFENLDPLGGGSQAEDASSADSVAEGALGEAGGARAEPGPEQQDHVAGDDKTSPLRDSLNPSNVAPFAEMVTRKGARVPAVPKSCAPVRVPERQIVAAARWNNARAIVLVDREHRRVSVFDCETASRQFYTGKY